jgi:hypothetical protein
MCSFKLFVKKYSYVYMEIMSISGLFSELNMLSLRGIRPWDDK